MAFTDRIEREDFTKMPHEYQDLLTRVLTIQSDCEIGGPNVYARRWMLQAPTADDMHRVARIVAEEIDHYRKFAGVLAGIGVDVSYLLHRRNSERMLDAFHEDDPPTWADVAAFCALIDRVGRYQGEEFYHSSYRPLDSILPSIMQEEVGHIAFGVQKLQELCKTAEGAWAAQVAVDRWVPRGLDMFGRAESRRAERYLYWGLKRRTNEQGRQEYLAEITTLIENLGLKMPDVAAHRVYV
jgi:ring-1,2-phenylacetyl-CoA epoxidase subunit PaaA